MLSFSLLVAMLAMVPAYFSTSLQVKASKEVLARQQNNTPSEEELKVVNQVKSLEQKLDFVNTGNDNNYVFSEEILDSLLLKKTNRIKIDEILYESSQREDQRKVIVRGQATSRESLLDFRVSLERDPKWQEVDLPVSNFVQGANINFSLTLLTDY